MAGLEIEATVAGAQSNSYVTLPEADTYFAGRLHAQAWETASQGDKEKALVSACRAIGALKLASHRRPYGYPRELVNALDSQYDALLVADAAQALAFPRLRDLDSAGAYMIPERVKQAQCEEALALLAFGAEQARRSALHAGGVSSFSTDGLSESYHEGAGASPLVSAEARQLIQSFLQLGGVIATSALPDGEFTPGSGQ